MKRIHIVGRKNHGKTTLLVELVEHLTKRGLRVGTIKHTCHVHDLDTPGSDSYRHRRAGAAPAAIVTGNLFGVFLPADGSDYCGRLAPWFAGCDLVLVEGDLQSPGPKIEVWRETAGTPCLALERSDIAVVVTDDRLPARVPVLPRSDLGPLLRHVELLAAADSQEAVL